MHAIECQKELTIGAFVYHIMFSFRRTKETMQSNMTGRYRYYKGNEYTILGVACHCETLEELVVYRAEYGECEMWVRSLKMFFLKPLKSMEKDAAI